jgi:hypothetical protein
MAGKGDRDRGHKRDNYPHIFRKDECECEECRAECKRALIETNPYLKDPVLRDEMLRVSAASSTAIELGGEEDEEA